MQTVEQEKPRLMVSITKEMVTISFGLCLENSSNFIMLIIILWLKGYKGSAHKMLVVLSKEMMAFVENVQLVLAEIVIVTRKEILQIKYQYVIWVNINL